LNRNYFHDSLIYSAIRTLNGRWPLVVAGRARSGAAGRSLAYSRVQCADRGYPRSSLGRRDRWLQSKFLTKQNLL